LRSAKFLEISEYDWLVFDWSRALHALRALETLRQDGVSCIGTAECGRHGTLYIPGLGARVELDRCRTCCRATGMPQGMQSPKNDARCRAVMDARVQRRAS
jgi:hypothetical protein